MAEHCSACGFERHLVAAEDINEDFQLQELRCAMCKTTVRLVVEKRPADPRRRGTQTSR